MMGEIKLVITRSKNFVAATLPYTIYVNGLKAGTIIVGKTVELTIKNEPTILQVNMMGGAFTFHKMVKEVRLLPEYCKTGVIRCQVNTKANLTGIFTMGLFGPVGHIELQVNYE